MKRRSRKGLAGQEPKGFLKPPKLITIKAKPEPIEMALRGKAVIVIDTQNSFLSKGGLSDILGVVSISASRAVRAVMNNKKIIDVARKASCKIEYLKGVTNLIMLRVEVLNRQIGMKTQA